MSWLAYALMTVGAWGVYGVLLHTGQLSMADKANGRYKAFLFVGIAYFLTAVLAPLAVLMMRGASWAMPTQGMTWSLIAGIAGAVGAFSTLLAFGAKGSPAAVMSIVFGGAPIVNAIVALAMQPPLGGLSAIPQLFFVGLLLAAAGGFLVTRFRPAVAHGPDPGAPSGAAPSPQSAGMAWLGFALITVAAWGIYGVLLNLGQKKMQDSANGLFKAFLFVGIAYFLTAVLAPMALLAARKSGWSMPGKGMSWSLVAGVAGAIGAFCTLLAFGAKGSPAVVMAIVFGGAPIVNAFVALLTQRPRTSLSVIPAPFFLGLALAATGGFLVTRFRPLPPHGATAPKTHAAVPASRTARQ